jgi:hypothetical protein
MIKVSKTLLILSFLFSCTSVGEQKNNSGKDKDSGKNSFDRRDTVALSNIGYYKTEGDSLIIPPFEIEVNLTEKANKKINNDKETIIVSAYFSGQPTDTTTKEYLENGEISITASERELSNGRVARFEGVKFSRLLYNSLADKDIQLLINIYSGRKSTNVNLLNCDILQDRMSNIKNKKFTIKGKLIGDN